MFMTKAYVYVYIKIKVCVCVSFLIGTIQLCLKFFISTKYLEMA